LALQLESINIANISFILLNMPILDLIMVAGTMQLSLGRASKFTIFDQTKEMAYIPLSVEEKRSYKAVIDGFVSRIGKSISSVLIQFLLILTAGSIDLATPYVFGIMAISLFAWLWAVNSLGYHYKLLIKKTTKQEGVI